MTWAKLDDSFYDDPDAYLAGPEARELYLCALTYSAKHLTDGLVGAELLPLLASKIQLDPSQTNKAADMLVERGFWAHHPAGFEIVGYLENNPSRVEVEAKRTRERDKKRRQRRSAGGTFAPPTPTVSPGDTERDGLGDDARESPPSHPIPSHPENPSLSRDDGQDLSTGHGEEEREDGENGPGLTLVDDPVIDLTDDGVDADELVVRAACEILARRDMVGRQPQNPEAYFAECVRRRLDQHRDTGLELVQNVPELGENALAEALADPILANHVLESAGAAARADVCPYSSLDDPHAPHDDPAACPALEIDAR